LTNYQIPFPGWDEVYRIFREEDYVDIVPPSDSAMRNTNDFVFTNIRRSHLHNFSSRTLAMPYSNAIECVIKNIYIDNITMSNDEGGCITSYQPS